MNTLGRRNERGVHVMSRRNKSVHVMSRRNERGVHVMSRITAFVLI